MAITFDPKTYGAWFDSALGRRVWTDEEHALFEVLQPKSGRRVLDAGCGDGRLLVSLARRGVRAVGVDASAAMLRAARDRARSAGVPVHLVRAEIGALPFPDDTFDMVAAVTVLCFMTDARPALHEMARTVALGGRVVVGELGRWSAWAVAQRRRAWRSGGLWSAARFWSRRQLRAGLREAGLEPRAAAAAVFYPRSVVLARLLRPLEPWLGRRTSLGAAFLVAGGVKRRPLTSTPRELDRP